MKPAALLLLAVVVLTHYLAPAAELIGVNPRFAFYVARSIEGMALFWLLAQGRRGVFLVACMLGFALELMVAVCGAFFWISDLAPQPWEQLCDTSTGVPISSITLVAVVLVAGIITGKTSWQKSGRL
ncbi:MAG: hypothetical protein RJA36_907 [Pseudomonadota bacterium]